MVKEKLQETAVKLDKAHKTAKKMEKHAEEILTAVSLTAVVGFAGYQAYNNHNNGIGWILLLAAAVYLGTEAFRAWYRALNK